MPDALPCNGIRIDNSVASCCEIVQTVSVTEPEQSANGWPPIDPADGLAQILTDLQRDLHEIDPGHVVRQVKQKFGTLDVWAVASDPALAHAVHERATIAEQQSGTTCERCGALGLLHQRANGWMRVECDVHAQLELRWPACPWPGWALLYARLIEDLVDIDEDLIVEGVEVRDGELRVAVRGNGVDRHHVALTRISDAEDASLPVCVVCGVESHLPHGASPATM